MEKGIKNICFNKKASYDYFLETTFETGIILEGSEIKSLKNGNVNLKDSHIQIKNGEAFVINMHISPYTNGSVFNPDPTRTRKLLLHKQEIRKLDIKVKEKGYTIVPTKVYLKNGLAKLEIALAKGKKNYDKREVEKEKTINRNIRAMIKEINR
jgi:SsrA-binding protein